MIICWSKLKFGAITLAALLSKPPIDLSIQIHWLFGASEEKGSFWDKPNRDPPQNTNMVWTEAKRLTLRQNCWYKSANWVPFETKMLCAEFQTSRVKSYLLPHRCHYCVLFYEKEPRLFMFVCNILFLFVDIWRKLESFLGSMKQIDVTMGNF